MAAAYGPYTGIIQERRFRMLVPVGDRHAELTGQPDWFNTKTGHLEDWKSTKQVPKIVYDDHVKQVNIYAALIELGTMDDPPDWLALHKIRDLSVQKAFVRYIDPDRSVSMEVPLWENRVTMDWVAARMEPIVRFRETGDLPVGLAAEPDQFWKSRYCPFRGTGQCCAD
jgi:hypothetical protein